MALQGQVRPRIGEIKKKKKINPFDIDNLRNGVNTVISKIIMNGGSHVGSNSAEKDLEVLMHRLTPPNCASNCVQDCVSKTQLRAVILPLHSTGET